MKKINKSIEMKKWFFIYHSVNPNIWSTPKGFASALKKLGIEIFEFTYADPSDFRFPDNNYFIKNEIKLLNDLRTKIPSYMIPDKIYYHETIQKNRNGKIDRNGIKKNIKEWINQN